MNERSPVKHTSVENPASPKLRRAGSKYSISVYTAMLRVCDSQIY